MKLDTYELVHDFCSEDFSHWGKLCYNGCEETLLFNHCTQEHQRNRRKCYSNSQVTV